MININSITKKEKNMSYLERVKDVVNINDLCFLKEDDIWETLDTSKAIIFDGHFELISNRHTDTFFRFAAISQYPTYVAKISKELVAWLKHNDIPEIDVVLGPSSQGLFFAYDIARELNGTMGTRAVYAAINKKTGRPAKELVEGFEIKPDEKVLVVNDLTTTGEGLDTLISLAEKKSGQVVGVCLFANRGIGVQKVEEISNQYKFHSIIDLDMPFWSKTECSRKCDREKKMIYSKDINHLPIYSEENEYERYIKKLELVA